MATLVLASAGAAVGNALMPAGISLMGAQLSGAVLGRAAGALAGRYIDQALFGASGQNRVIENTGSRLADLQVTSSSEGAPIPRVFGRARLGGQIIWATNFEEQVVRSSTERSTGGSGGKGLGGGGGGSGATVVTTSYLYYANFAVALCEGEITGIGSVWSDGEKIDLSKYTYRLYKGDEAQLPDSLIEAKEGAGNAPAYRGIAYIVFERLPLADFGNRIPQLNFEVFKAVDDVEQQIAAVTLIPASGEFAYEVEPVERSDGQGGVLSENVHHLFGGTDWTASIDQLQDVMPNCQAVSLFVSWFGTDLRAGHCQVRPAVETRDKQTVPYEWSVAGETRASAHLVSRIEDRPAYGGTPSDRSVIAAIKDLKARGLKTTFNPFLMMDIPAGGGLPDPDGASEQPAYPWRGRITCHPAAGQNGSPDKSAAAATQISSFVGSCSVNHFDISSGEVVYSGPAEWSWRRMVLHYAHLCKLAGGVDAFLLGSEMRGLSTVRDSASSYPFVAALVQLAADVRTILGLGTKISYAADWSEYFGHQPVDGSGDVHFHLDPLWSSADIDAIAIDCYWPLSDWRDNDDHLDAADWSSIYELGYLKGNIAGGEGYDWYYASSEDRDAQLRTPITDGQGKPWLFRYKDILNWWNNLHYDRPGGMEAATPTDWLPRGKPFWLMEIGCPALDKGANEPNLFYDPKSSESRLPHHSSGARDDTIQRRYLQAFHERFDPAFEDFEEADNPVSEIYGGRMVDPAMIHAYTWDARPYPAFPFNSEVWSDGGNWFYGHWLGGRMAGGPLHAVIEAILQDYGFTEYELSGINGMMEGYILDSVMSAREALQPLEMAFFLDSFESGGRIRFAHKGQGGLAATFVRDGLVEQQKDGELYALTRAQETDLPHSAKITYIDGLVDYRQAVVESRRHVGASRRVSTAQLPIVLGQQQAQSIADSWLHDVWSGREKAGFALPPSSLALEPGDLLRLEQDDGRALDLRMASLETAETQTVEAISLQPHIYSAGQAPLRLSVPPDGQVFGPPLVLFLDLPLLRGDEPDAAGYVAAYQSPWPGSVSFYRSAGDSGYGIAARAPAPAVIGELTAPLVDGPHSRWDHGAQLDVQLYDGELIAKERLELLSGGNLAAVEHASGEWEVLQFRDVELLQPGAYRLSGLLRGLAGTEAHVRGDLAEGARFVLLDDAVQRLDLTLDEIGLAYNWKVGPSLYDIGHRSYQSYTRAFSGLGLKPLAPVHIRASREAAGDIRLNWTRRTRRGGDGWQTVETPLAETEERYELNVLKDGELVRTLEASAPSLSYSLADQIADFGAAPPSLHVRLAQYSATLGSGHSAEITLTL